MTVNLFYTGGRTSLLTLEPFTQILISVPHFSFFTSSFVTVKLFRSNFVFSLYRPPSSSTFSKPFSVFSVNLVPSFL